MNRRTLLVGAGCAAGGLAIGSIGWTASVGAMADYSRYARRLRRPLADKPDVRELVRYAVLAANGHNTQPWRFAVSERTIALSPDLERRTPVVDPDDHHLFVSLGCAAENLAIAAFASGRPGEARFDPSGNVIRYTFDHGLPVAHPLLDAIPMRQSTRTEYDGRAIPAVDLRALERAAAEPGVRIILVTGRQRRDQIRDLVLTGNDMQLSNPAFMAELATWVRFNPNSAMRSGDGLFSAASGNMTVPTFLGKRVFSMVVAPKSERVRYARQLESSPALAVFVCEKADRDHWIRVGRACQRLGLTATTLGLKLAFVNQPVEVPQLRHELASLIGEPGLRPDLVLRLGYGPSLPYAPRRPVDDILAA